MTQQPPSDPSQSGPGFDPYGASPGPSATSGQPTQPTQPLPQQPWPGTQPLPQQQWDQAAAQQWAQATGTPAPEAQFGPPPGPRKKRTGLIVGAVVAAVVVVGGGGAFAAYQTVLAPKGSQPDAVIPASAVAFVRLDLDPSAGQKIAATRFLSKLPGVKKNGDDSVDIKQSLWDLAVKSEPDLASLDYATDVQPWLGDRAGLAVLPGGTAEEPNVVVALAATDEAKAKAGIEKVATTGGGSGDVEVTTKDGFALVTPRGKGAALLSDLAKGSLASNDTYTSDMADLGDAGVASAWADGKGLTDLAKSVDSGVDTSSVTGSGTFAVALRFDADYLELAGVQRGATLKPTTAPPTGGAATLPADTMAAVQLNGLGDTITQLWPQLAKALPADTLSGIEDAYDVKLPADLATLLGSSFTVALPKQDFSSIGDGKLPVVGIKDVTGDPTRAEEILTRVSSDVGFDDYVKHTVKDTTLYLSTDDAYLATLQQQGTLGSTDLFRKAVADPDKATQVAFVNLEGLQSVITDAPADSQDLLKALKGVGFSATQGTDGNASFALRLVGS